MFILLGGINDACVNEVSTDLRCRQKEVLVINNLFDSEALVRYEVDTDGLKSAIFFKGRRIDGDEIEGVLFRGGAWIARDGWTDKDWEYIQSETQAAMLAWLWCLACPVVNRARADLWYRPRMHLACWNPLLRRSGLECPPILISNREDDLKAFAGSFEGTIYTPLMSADKFLVATDSDWKNVSHLATLAPVCLSRPHGKARRAFVVGSIVIWDGVIPGDLAELDPKILRFAELAGLGFLMVLVAPVDGRWCVVGVDAQPDISSLDAKIAKQIVQQLVGVLLRPALNPLRKGSLEVPGDDEIVKEQYAQSLVV